jgi:nephrocystin-3
MIRLFPEWLAEVSNKGGMVLVLDGLDQLSPAENAHELRWLPEKLPTNISLVVSTLPGRCLEVVKQRGWHQLVVEGLGEAERGRLVEEYMAKHSKSVTSHQLLKLVTAKQTSSPLFLKTLLDELRVYGVFEKLESRIDHYLSAQSPSHLFGLVFERLEQDFEENVEETETNENSRKTPNSSSNGGDGLVGRVFSYLWVARKGLSEGELLGLLGGDVPYARWSPLYIAIEESLINRSGFLTFFHDYMRQAVNDRYLNSEKIKKLRQELIRFFSPGGGASALSLNSTSSSSSSSASTSSTTEFLFGSSNENQTALLRRVEEVPFQKQQCGDWQGLAEFISDLCHFEILTSPSNLVEFYKYWSFVQQQSGVRPEQQTLTEVLLVRNLQNLYANTPKNDSAKIDKVCKLFIKAGEILQELAAYNSAERLFLQVLQDRVARHEVNAMQTFRYSTARNVDAKKKAKIDDEHELAKAKSILGKFYEKTGQYSKAAPLLESGLQILQAKADARQKEAALALTDINSNDGDNDDDDKNDQQKFEMIKQEKDIEIEIKSVLGTVYRRQGKYTEALKVLKDVLRETIAKDGRESESVARIYQQLGIVYQNMGQYPQGIHYLSSSSKLREAIWGREHPKLAESLKDEGDLYILWSKYDEALATLYRGLNIYENTFGPSHPGYADTLGSIATVKFNKGEYAESEELFLRAVELQRKTIGDLHPDLANNYNNFAGLYLRQNIFDKATQYYDKALHIRETVLGREHADYATSLANIGSLKQKMKLFQEAFGFFEKALAIFERIYEDGKHMDIATALINMAGTSQQMHQYPRCVGYYTRALTILLDLLGPWHSFVAVTLNDLSILLYNLKMWHEAEKMFENALKCYRQVFGEVHPSTAQVLYNYGDLWKEMEDKERARECYERALQMWTQTLGPDNSKTIKAADALAALADLQSLF